MSIPKENNERQESFAQRVLRKHPIKTSIVVCTVSTVGGIGIAVGLSQVYHRLKR